MGILGDDTGDNISEKRMSFCEFTVQYWAWKNVKADYYGLCHYRRYLSFSEKRYRVNHDGQVVVPALSERNKRRFGLLMPECMENIILSYDIIVSESANVNQIATPQGRKKTVRQMWEGFDGVFFEKTIIDDVVELIDRLFPIYSVSSREYLAGSRHRGFNCFVMKRELFNRLNEFQFAILRSLEETPELTNNFERMGRTLAYMGELLYGVFVHHISNYEQWRVGERQLLFVADAGVVTSCYITVLRYIVYSLKFVASVILNCLAPSGSKRRRWLKLLFAR